ncbi:OpgC domain-containing protein [Acidiphilium sp. AL]|uniref:OpgC domain-containing protein n=1 Tax=Acidiphilium iwatense TaxID=768198 RepID=A0ABS9DTS6_9PROT|nr:MULTISPECIES: OpgC domain-containing protein [Acidiphilium]MCF3946087.1 OpgC domain-containing protein [Acidiphilium iwatense]MCU4162069.1 OpgC domain-containing protein [Acidiphilium sp. AL]
MTLVRSGRDLRVDFFRGIALFCIFLDHIPHDALARFTVRNLALNDATEIFILLAGYAAALVYGRKLDRVGPISAGADMWKRTWTLYIAHIFLFAIFVAEVAVCAALFGHPEYIAQIGLVHLAKAPLAAMAEAVPMLYQPAFLNVLPLYVVIMGGVAPFLILLRRPRILLAASFALYAGARIFGWNLPTWSGHGWFFNPFTWQFLFVLGMLFARFGRPNLPGVSTDIVAVLLLAVGFAILLTTWIEPSLARHVPPAIRPLIRDIDKTGLHPYRLASILALAWLAARYVPPGAAFLSGRVGSVFVLIGQHGLNTYCASILLSFAGRVALERDPGWVSQIIVNLAGLAALFAVAAIGAWYKVKDAKPAG